jgi:RND family efflux transporter MFP subunit
MPETSPKSRPLVWGGLALALVAAIAVAAFFALRPVAVVEQVVSGSALDAKPGSIVVNPDYTMELRSEIGGRVLERGFSLDPGKSVKEGDVLAQLDTTSLDIQIEKSQIDYDSARKRIAVGSSALLDLENAQADLANYEHLNALGGYADGELAKRRREVEILKQRVDLEKVANDTELATYVNMLKAERHQRDAMTIRAPFDGVVSQIYAHPGDLVSGGASIATLITTKKKVEARISEEDFADIRVGEKALVLFLPYGNATFDATVTKILPTADPETQRHGAILDVAIPPEKLVPGITGEVSIVVGAHEAHAIIPRRALFAGDQVFAVVDGRVELRRVRKGFVWLRGVEILDGVSPGEQVIVEDLDRYHDGSRVRTREVAVDSTAAGGS